LLNSKKNSTATTNDGPTVGYEAQLWQMADSLLGSMDAIANLKSENT